MFSAFLYDIGIGILGKAMQLGARFSPKLALGLLGRENLLDRLETTFSTLEAGRKVAWFHAASLGEFEQGRPVIEEFRKFYPKHFILLTFFSPSGYEVRKNYTGADYICYLPFDSEFNARRFVGIVKPEIAFFIKYEFWYNYLKELRSQRTFILSFSTIFRSDQVFFKSYGSFYRKLLTYFDHILVQNQESVNLLAEIQISACTLAGDTRFDRVKQIASSVRDLPEIFDFKGHHFCLAAGSVWQADMDVLITSLNDLSFPAKAIIAPHEIKNEQMEEWRKLLTGKSKFYSEYIQNTQDTDFQYLIIDNIGMLSSLYRYADVAYIGGAFGSGLHNILEAATFGLPVIFGNKKYSKFQEAIDLVEQRGAVAIADSADLSKNLEHLFAAASLRSTMGETSRNYVLSRTGATDSVMQKVKSLLGTGPNKL